MILDDIYDKLNKIDLKGYILVRTGVKKLLLLKTNYKYSNCIYINLVSDNIEVRIDRVFDNKYIYNGIERLYCFNNIFKSTDDVIDCLMSYI